MDHPETIEANREFRADRLADYIRATVDRFPPLTQAQLDRLAVLLRGSDQ